MPWRRFADTTCASTPCIRSQRRSRRAFPPSFAGVCGWVVCAKNWQLGGARRPEGTAPGWAQSADGTGRLRQAAASRPGFPVPPPPLFSSLSPTRSPSGQRPPRRRARGGTACVEEKGRLKCLSTEGRSHKAEPFGSILWRLPWPTLGAGEGFAARKIPSCAGVEVCIRKISLRLMEEAIHG